MVPHFYAVRSCCANHKNYRTINDAKLDVTPFQLEMNVSEHFTLLARKRDCESYEIVLF